MTMIKHTTDQKVNAFKHFYENLPASTQKGFISLVCQGCDISEPTFYRWINNPEQIRKPAREKIAQIANKSIEDLFNSQTI